MSILSTVFPSNPTISALFPATAQQLYSQRAHILALISLHEPSFPEITPLRITLTSDLFETSCLHKLASWKATHPNPTDSETFSAVSNTIAELIIHRKQQTLLEFLATLPVPSSKQ